MPMRRDYLFVALVTVVAGCSARAEDERQARGEPGEIRISNDAARALLTPLRQVSVVGSARQSVVPDVADIDLGLSVSRATVAEAVEANNRGMGDLIAAVKGRGITAKDMQTSQISVSPQYSRPEEAKPGVPPEATVPKVVGYEVSNTLRVTVRDTSKVGDLLASALKVNSIHLNGVSFRVADRDAVISSLRIKAFDLARSKAEAYAKRSMMELGQVIQITEADPWWAGSPQAPMGYAPAAAPAPAPAAESMPVSAGEQEISLSVTVAFELKSAR